MHLNFVRNGWGESCHYPQVKLLFALSFLSAVTPFAQGQNATVFASGLLNPSKMILTSGGSLLVSEAAQTPNSGRISIIDKSGVRRTLIDGLPSGLAAPNKDVDGPNGLALASTPANATVLYINIGEGDSFQNGTKPNTIVPNQNGASSPIFASILRLTMTQSVDNFTGSFSLAAQDQSTLADGNTVTLKSGSKTDTATLDVLSFFRSGTPDPVTIWRNSHLYGMTLHPAFPGSLFVTDAGMNSVVQISLPSGRAHTVVHFPPLPSGVPGPPVSEAVPTTIHPFGNQLLVSFLVGFPFTPGRSEVVTLNAATGTVTPFITGLSSAVDVLDVQRAGPRDLFFTLEYSTNMGATPPAPGRVTRYDTAVGQVLASNLNGPTGMVYDATGGNLYVLTHNDGTIVRIAGQ